MKQLSLRLFAPITEARSFVNRLTQSSARTISKASTIPQLLKGKYRLYMNYCPECNSCAPKIHDCEVCNANTKAYFDWNDEIKQAWWKKYVEKNHIAV